jgi:hypothetical protein
MYSLSTFGARMSHEQIQTHKTHHNQDLGEATTFPLIVYSMPLHGAHIQMAVCPRTPKWESGNCQVGILATLEPHNFACKPLIWDEVRSKVVSLVNNFPMICCMPLTRKENESIFDFSWSGVKLPIWLLNILLAHWMLVSRCSWVRKFFRRTIHLFRA